MKMKQLKGRSKKVKASQEKTSQEIESVFTTEDHDGDYDDFVSFNFH